MVEKIVQISTKHAAEAAAFATARAIKEIIGELTKEKGEKSKATTTTTTTETIVVNDDETEVIEQETFDKGQSKNSPISEIETDESKTEETPKNQGEFEKGVAKQISEKFGQEFWDDFFHFSTQTQGIQ